MDAEGVGLSDVAGGVDGVVQEDQHALTARGCSGGEAEGVQQVQVAVRADGAGGTHGTGDDDRLVGLER